jgi:hypothetical protein
MPARLTGNWYNILLDPNEITPRCEWSVPADRLAACDEHRARAAQAPLTLKLPNVRALPTYLMRATVGRLNLSDEHSRWSSAGGYPLPEM